MSFYQRYELARLIGDGETKTFRAIENATGRSVLFHFFNPEGQPVLAAIKSKWGKVPGKPERPILEIGEFAGSPYAVTELIEPFTTLRQWVNSVESGALPLASAPPLNPTSAMAPPSLDDTVEMVLPREVAKAPTTPVAPPAASSQPPGAFTQMFEHPPAPPPQPRPGPGEFTRWFDMSPSATPPKAAQSPGGQQIESRPELNLESSKKESKQDPFDRMFEASPAPSLSAHAERTDEFDKLFGGNRAPEPRKPAVRIDPFKNPFEETRAPAPPRSSAPPANAKPSWPASPTRAEETGQFTRLFGSGPSGEAINIEEEQARAARSAQPEGRPFQAPTEFTRVFGPEDGVNAPPPRPPTPTKIGSASRLFGSMAELKADAPTKSSGPGEYTRITTRAELEAEQAALDRAKAAQAPPAPMAARRGLAIGIAIGGVVLVIAIIAVLIIVLRKH